MHVILNQEILSLGSKLYELKVRGLEARFFGGVEFGKEGSNHSNGSNSKSGKEIDKSDKVRRFVNNADPMIVTIGLTFLKFRSWFRAMEVKNCRQP